MRRFTLTLIALAFGFLNGVCLAEEDGWKTLFNGKDLTGWKVSENKDSIYVEDGHLVTHGRRLWGRVGAFGKVGGSHDLVRQDRDPDRVRVGDALGAGSVGGLATGAPGHPVEHARGAVVSRQKDLLAPCSRTVPLAGPSQTWLPFRL